MEQIYLLKNLDCAQCAAKMEAQIQTLEGVEKAEINFITKKLKMFLPEPSPHILQKVRDIVQNLEPDVEIILETEQGEASEEEDDRSLLYRLGIGLIFFVAGFFLPGDLLRFLSFLIGYLIAGYSVLIKAGKGILRKQPFNENFLMSIATVGAFAIGESPEGAAVMLFYLLGEVFQNKAVDRSRRSIKDLMDLRPDTARVIQGEEIVILPSDQVQIGDRLLLRPGDQVPMDGIVRKGEAMLDTSALTGESVPRRTKEGDEILSGSINRDGLLEMEVQKNFGESTMAKILELVENAAAKKAPTEQFITKFARVYTPIVVISALLLATLPPLLIPGAVFSDWLYRALIFLVVSCPCALVVSIPLGFFGGIGRASRQGILIKGGNYLEALNEVDTVVFDKTGTLSKGEFAVQEVVPVEGTRENILELAALAESWSTHPIAASIRQAVGTVDSSRVDRVEEIAGQGVKARVDGRWVLAGNRKLLHTHHITVPSAAEEGTLVFIAVEGVYAGFLSISDALKSDARNAVTALKKLGVHRTVMLTGDREEVAAQTAQQVGVTEYEAELLPGQKVEALERREKSRHRKGRIAFVGDGINDAPVLARADIGIAMGGVGSDAAIEAADIVLMTDEPSKVAVAIQIARDTRSIVTQNIVFSLGVKVLVLVLSVLGIATMWGAVFADVGVTVLAVMNSMRLLRAPKTV